MPNTFDVEVTGLDTTIEKLQGVRDDWRTAVATALYLEANDILNASQRLVPVELGTLKSSGAVTAPEIGLDSVEVTVGYGGAASEYAIYVHEDMEARHDYPTQAKFLEQPALEALDGMADRIARSVREGLF